MQRMQRITPALALTPLLVLGFVTMLVAANPGPAWGEEPLAPVTVVYTSDVKGHIEPCG